MSSTQDSELLNEIITLCHDGALFYREAASGVKSLELSSMFREMAEQREQIAADISEKVRRMGEEPAYGGTLVGRMRTMYADVRARLSSDVDYQYVKELEVAEQRTLDALKEGVRQVEYPVLAEELALHLAAIQLMQDRVRERSEKFFSTER